MNKHHSAVESAAWIVNWFCIVLIFGGLVVLGDTVRDNTAIRDAQVRQLSELIARQDREIGQLQDLLPHVIKIEEIVSAGCDP